MRARRSRAPVSSVSCARSRTHAGGGWRRPRMPPSRRPSAPMPSSSQRFAGTSLPCRTTSDARMQAQLAIVSHLIDSYMAMQSYSDLDLTFRALADGTRRSMIQVLARGEARSAGELGSQFSSAQPTISKHLKVLEQAGLVERTIEGRMHRFRLRQKPLRDAEQWIVRHQSFWTGAVDQLDRLLSKVASDES